VILVIIFVFFSALIGEFPAAGPSAERAQMPPPAQKQWPVSTDFDELRYASAARSAETPAGSGPALPTWKSRYYLRDGPETLRVAGVPAPPTGELALG